MPDEHGQPTAEELNEAAQQEVRDRQTAERERKEALRNQRDDYNNGGKRPRR